MDSITGYDSSSDVEDAPAVNDYQLQAACVKPVSCAPMVITSLVVTSKGPALKGLNSQVDVMMAPRLGPANPFTGLVGETTPGMARTGVGYVESTFVEDHAFNESYQDYLRGDRRATSEPKGELLLSLLCR